MSAHAHYLITLLQEGYTTIQAQFLTSTKEYTYKAPLDMNIGVNDMVIVPANGDFKMVQVSGVDAGPALDIRTPYAIRWVVCKVDFDRYEQQVKAEEDAVAWLTSIFNGTELKAILNGGQPASDD